jgi:predicted GNAT family acetyltransferase
LRRPEPIAGRFEPASLEALPLVVEWTAAFHAEVPDIGPPPTIELLETRIRNGLVFVWIGEDGRPASMVVTGRETPNGAAIQFVYTPPELRGRGFASSSVAAVCEAIFARGKQHCALFADLENPIALRVYERLGFERVGVVEHYLFERGT